MNLDIPLPPPRHCADCRRVLERARRRARSVVARSVDVQTWCRTCGKPALINVLLDYRRAVKMFQILSYTTMTHDVGQHIEEGGWGWRWRLDEVLSRVFPREYSDDRRTPHWAPLWGEHQVNSLSMDRPIRIVHNVADAMVSPDVRETNRRRLEEAINKTPRTRAELAASAGPVWDEHEVELEFDVCGFTPPFVLVVRKTDGLLGSLIFQRQPLLYWGFDPGRVV